MEEIRIIEVKQSVFAANDVRANDLRNDLKNGVHDMEKPRQADKGL